MTCCSLVTWICPLFREDAMFLFLCSLCPHRNYMNDSLRTNVFVRFQAETIACACIYLAARALQVRGNSVSAKSVFFFCPLSLAVCSANASVETFDAIFPQIPLPTKPHWYLLFGVTEDEIKEVCITTLKLYTRKKVLFLKSRKSPRPVRFNIVKRESLTPTVHSTLLWTVMTVV